VSDAADWLHVLTTDLSLPGLIVAAREQVENFTGRSCASRTFEQALDSFPYFVDTIQSQLAYPPSYYSLPRYSTTLWNYSQLIVLGRSPLVSVDRITYIGTDGLPHDLFPGIDFVVDYLSEPPRIFPLPGGTWPACFYTPNAVVIKYTAGYDPNPTEVLEVGTVLSPPLSPPTGLDITTNLPNPPEQQASYSLTIGIPQTLRTAILMYVAHFYFNREPVAAGSAVELPLGLTSLLWSHTVFAASTRG
jgi:hypothetical protein